MSDENSNAGKWTMPLFEDALQAQADNEQAGYLGDDDVVASLLRDAASAFVEAIVAGNDVTVSVEKKARALAKVFLGKNKKYSPVRRWNEPGAIDVFLAKWAGVESDDPVERVAGALLDMASELNDVIQEAIKPDVPPSRWRPAIDAILESYTELFQGVAPPVSAAR